MSVIKQHLTSHVVNKRVAYKNYIEWGRGNGRTDGTPSNKEWGKGGLSSSDQLQNCLSSSGGMQFDSIVQPTVACQSLLHYIYIHNDLDI
jgi:hypothetical protein